MLYYSRTKNSLLLFHKTGTREIVHRLVLPEASSQVFEAGSKYELPLHCSCADSLLLTNENVLEVLALLPLSSRYSLNRQLVHSRENTWLTKFLENYTSCRFLYSLQPY